jgi:hypothetical protein
MTSRCPRKSDARQNVVIYDTQVQLISDPFAGASSIPQIGPRVASAVDASVTAAGLTPVGDGRVDLDGDIVIRAIPVEPGYFPSRIESAGTPPRPIFGSLFDWDPARVVQAPPPR